MRTRQALTLEDARAIGAAAEAAAKENDWKVAIAVCDDGGHLLWLQRMDGAPPMCSEVAQEKARASALARKSSGVLEQMVNGGRFAAMRLPVMPLEGGEMVLVDGECIGAVGVSGVLPDQDALVARAGLQAIS